MGVTTRTTLGVGFKVEESDLIDFFGNEDYEEVGAYDLLDTYLDDYPLLTLESGGSGMDGRLEHVVAVSRLVQSLDAYEDAGLYGLDAPVLSLEERIQLLDVAADLLGREPKVGQFVAIYVG